MSNTRQALIVAVLLAVAVAVFFGYQAEQSKAKGNACEYVRDLAGDNRDC